MFRAAQVIFRDGRAHHITTLPGLSLRMRVPRDCPSLIPDSRKSAVSPSRYSDPLEALIQLFAGEHQRRWSAVGAVMRVVEQMPFFEQRVDFFDR